MSKGKQIVQMVFKENEDSFRDAADFIDKAAKMLAEGSSPEEIRSFKAMYHFKKVRAAAQSVKPCPDID